MTITLETLLADGCAPSGERKVCRSRGGESCAFDGAMIVLLPIADAAHIVHGPIACCGNAWEGRGVRSVVGDLHRRGFTTDVDELDIVFGGAEKLSDAVREVVRAERPQAVFVYETCVTGLIGEDIASVCRALTDELAVPVIPVPSAGFVGPKNLGNRIAGEVLIEHVIGTAEPPADAVGPCDVVLIGEYNVAGDLAFIEPLLAEAGITVLSRITGNARFAEIQWAHRAKVSVVVCSRALINVARALERRWGVPVVEASFFGPTEIASALTSIAAALEAVSPEAVGVRARAAAVIAAHEAELARRLRPHTPALAGKRAVLYSGGVKSWALASCLADLGIEVVAVGVKKTSYEDEAKLRERAPRARILEDVSPRTLRALFDGSNGEAADILMAGGRNRYLAAKEGWPFVDVNQERESAYAGYEGFCALARDIAHSVRFYGRHGRGAARGRSLGAARSRTTVRTTGRSSVMDPVKGAPTLGALLALQGVDRALPVLHAAQGCSFLAKVLAIRHANEPIACQTTALFTEDVVLASEEALVEPARRAASAAEPDVLALVSGALAEVKGDDLDAAAQALADAAPAVIAVRAPDFEGSLEAGWRAAVRALVGLAVTGPRAGSAPRTGVGRWRRVAVLPGCHLSPGDIAELSRLFEAFSLDPVFVPDVRALDGGRGGFGPLAVGGVGLEDLRRLGGCDHVLALGSAAAPVARELGARFTMPVTVVEATTGLGAADLLVRIVSGISGRSAPEHIEHERRVLVDAMRDAHGVFAGARIAIALEPDHALGVASLLDEMACPPVAAVVPVLTEAAARIPADEVIVGDLVSVPDGIDLLIGTEHAARTAAVRGAAHLGVGFPLPDVYGATRRTSVGHRGATALLDEIATVLTARRKEQHR